jgi:hypothetical protein
MASGSYDAILPNIVALDFVDSSKVWPKQLIDMNTRDVFKGFKGTAACAAWLAPRRGNMVFGVGENGSVQVASQEPGGHWTTWSEFKKPTDPPSDIIALAAAQDVNGYAQLWALTRDHVLHSRYESSVGKWTDWSDPKVGWFPSPKLTQICVCSPGGVPRGRHIWGVGQGGGLYTTYEDSSQKGGWFPWFQRAKWKWNGPPRTIIALATEIAGNGCRSLWALSSDHVLHYIYESSIGHWNDWSDFTIGGLPEIHPKFMQICACRTPWGLQFWAVDDGGGHSRDVGSLGRLGGLEGTGGYRHRRLDRSPTA